MKNRALVLGALVGAAGLLAFAAGIDGKWTAEVQGRNGTTTQTLTLKSAGMNLTGSLDNGRGAVDISEGMIHESDVTFKLVREFNGNKVTTNYKGTLSGDELKLTATPEGGGGGGGGKGRGPQDLTFKRAQ